MTIEGKVNTRLSCADVDSAVVLYYARTAGRGSPRAPALADPARGGDPRMPITLRLTPAAIGDLQPVYDGRLVALSLLIALLAAWACLDLAGPAAVAHGRARTLWLTGAALALGLGIWAMHFVAMLAYRLPLPVTYDAVVVALALGVALSGAGAGLALAARRPVRRGALLAAGAAVGGAIVGMHYTGMAGLHTAAMPMLDPLPLALSVALALGLSGAAFGLAFGPKAARSWPWRPRALGAAALLATAIASMHYVAMAGVHLMPVAAPPATSASAAPALDEAGLAKTIGLATVAILGSTLAGSVFGRRLRARLAALRRDEARFRAIAHHAADVAAVVTEGGRIRYVSPAPQGLLGHAPEDLEGMDLYTLVHPDDLARARAALDTAAAHGRADEALVRLRHGDGSWRAVDLVATDHRDDPAVDGLIVVGRDLTTRAEMEVALRHSHDDLAALNRRLIHGRAVLQALFDGLDDGLLLLDGAAHVQVANRALAALLGDAPAALHGRPWPEIARRLSPDAPAALELPAPGARSQHRLRYQAPDGAIRVLDVSIAVADGTAPLADGMEPADAARVIVRVVDATEAVQLRERALLGERFAAGGRLAASVAHEINTPLQTIQTTLRLLQAAPDADHGPLVTDMLGEVRRVGGIVHQLLDFYRPGAAIRGRVDLNALVERVALLLGERLRAGQVRVEIALDPSAPVVLGRADELTQVLLNLALNALDALPASGTLRISTATRDPASSMSTTGGGADAEGEATAGELVGLPVPHAALAVADDGPGIDAALRERLFKPFVTTKESGMGLGLWISRGIVEGHGGVIAARNRAAGGAVVTVLLPLDLDSDEETRGQNGEE